MTSIEGSLRIALEKVNKPPTRQGIVSSGEESP
jgi:hypothetical protein